MPELRTHKRCPRCDCVKPVDCFGRHARDGYRSRCKQCVKAAETSGEWSTGSKTQSKEAMRRQAKAHYSRHSERVKAVVYEWRRRNHEKVKAYREKESETLSDGYVRRRMADRSPVGAKDFPQGLVEAKREQLRLLRALKGLV